MRTEVAIRNNVLDANFVRGWSKKNILTVVSKMEAHLAK